MNHLKGSLRRLEFRVAENSPPTETKFLAAILERKRRVFETVELEQRTRSLEANLRVETERNGVE